MNNKEKLSTGEYPEDKEDVEYIDNEKAKKLLFLSYRFSQGKSELQYNIFEYLHDIRPRWRIGEKELPELQKALEETIQKYFGKSKDILLHPSSPMRDTVVIQESIKTEVKEFAEILNDKKEKINREEILSRIITRMIQGDSIFLSQKEGRERRATEGRKKSEHTDPWLSHLVYYGIQGHETGAEEYNQMFRDVRERIMPILLGEVSKYTNEKDLFKIVEKYKEKHPEEKLSLQ